MPSKASARVRSDVQPKALKCGQLMRRARPCRKTRPAKWPYAAPGILSVTGRTRKRPRKTLRDGWLYTGDLVRCDSDGYFWFMGRKKEIIIRCGSNISPQEVEDALYQHPAVVQTGVIGKPHPVYGEQVVAFVSLREGQEISEQQLMEFARKRLADYKTPERILFLPDLPKGPTGKVQRRALKEIAI